jgi:hypothetical protein
MLPKGLLCRNRRQLSTFPLCPSTYDRPSLEGVTVIFRSLPRAGAIPSVEREASALDATVTPFNALSMQEHISHFSRLCGQQLGLMAWLASSGLCWHLWDWAE